MSFQTRQYDLYAMLGDPVAEPPWMENAWSRIVVAVGSLIELSRGRAAVRSMQLIAGPGSPNKRAISFGRIGWNTAGHKKWVWPSQGTDGGGINRVFCMSEVWAPSWTTCEEERQPPDVYFAVRNEDDNRGLQLSFNPVCVLAIARDRSTEFTDQGKKAAEASAQILQALVRVHRERPWNYRSGQTSTDAVNDLVVTGLFKPGPRHQNPASSSMLNGVWNTF
jgi:hypothetical protein